MSRNPPPADAEETSPAVSLAGNKNDRRRSDEQQGFWTAYYVNTYVLGFNTHVVKKEAVPKTYEALLDPRWKGGKISIDTEAYGMFQGLIAAWGRKRRSKPD